MSDLTDELCDLRRQQLESPHLLSPARVLPIINRAETRLNELRTNRPLPDSPEWFEADCLVSNLDDLQVRRADLIWDLAYHDAGVLDDMTASEGEIYTLLTRLSEQLRGES